MKVTNWSSFAINGAIALIFGLFALFVPEETINLVAKYFGLLILLAGIIILIVALTNKKHDKPYTIPLAEAVTAIVIGCIIFFFTKETLTVFVIVIGLWAIIIGIVQLIIAFRIKEPKQDRYLVIINGLLTIVFGIIMFRNPFETAVALVYVTGIIAIIVGSFLLFFSFRLKALDKDN